ncbi:MAG: class I SAM-dependent methyltransferase [Myxococcales bacterium]|nr:class I SAM-dependent methyltransferase [Myxococcales bacterium]
MDAWAPFRYVLTKVHFPMYKSQMARSIAALLPEHGRVLDVGCDTGAVAKAIMAHKPGLEIVGVDIPSQRPAEIERFTYDGKKLPFDDGSFDVVMANDVLHHLPSRAAIHELVREMRRVSRRDLLIKEQTHYDPLTWTVISFNDWITNAPYGIRCTYQFQTKAQWKELFAALELDIIEHSSDGLNFGVGGGELFNPIFTVRRRDAW